MMFLFIYICGYLVSAVTCMGWVMADEQSERCYDDKGNYRRDLGFSVGWSCCMQLFWPLTLPLVFCITGFAEHGWSVKRKAKP